MLGNALKFIHRGLPHFGRPHWRTT